MTDASVAPHPSLVYVVCTRLHTIHVPTLVSSVYIHIVLHIIECTFVNVSSFILPDAAIQIWPTEIFLTEKKSRIFTVKGCVSLRINLSLMPSTQTKINFLKVEEKFQKKYDKARKKCNQWSSLFISWKTKGCQSFRIWLWKDKIFKRFHQRYRAFSHNFTIFLTIWRVDLKMISW